MSQKDNEFILHSLLDESQSYLTGKMVAILGPKGALRADLMLELLSSVASRQDILFLHSRLHFPVERFKELTGGDDHRLERVRLVYLPDFSFQERTVSLLEMFMVRENFQFLFFDGPIDNYLDSLSLNWNASSALKRTHSSFVRQLATLKTLCLERGIGVLLTVDSNENGMTVPRYAVDIWPDLIVTMEQIEPMRGRIQVRTKAQNQPGEFHDIIIKKEGPDIE